MCEMSAEHFNYISSTKFNFLPRAIIKSLPTPISEKKRFYFNKIFTMQLGFLINRALEVTRKTVEGKKWDLGEG